MPNQNDNPLWKQRYERLVSYLQDIDIQIKNMGLEADGNRAWDAPQTIYVSFSFDVCDSEEYALKNFGKDNYDVYKLWLRSPKP